MPQHAKKFAYTADAHVPLRVHTQTRLGFAADDVLLRTEAGSIADLRDIRTDAGHLLDAHGGKSVLLYNVYSPISPLHYGISNFTATMESLTLRWDKAMTFQQGPDEAWMRLHHIGTLVVDGLRLNGWRHMGKDGPKEPVQIRSGEYFEYATCKINGPISIGPNKVDGIIDPHAEPVHEVLFKSCSLREWPRLVEPAKYIHRVVFDQCTIAGDLCKFKQILHGRGAA